MFNIMFAKVTKKINPPSSVEKSSC